MRTNVHLGKVQPVRHFGSLPSQYISHLQRARAWW